MGGILRVAIAGAGKAGAGHASAFSQCPDAEVVRVMSRSLESAEKLAKAHGVLRFSTSYSDICQDAEVDAVIVASPDPFHYEQALSAIHAGKHVLCEKPMCRNATEAAELVNAAHQKRKVLMVGFVERFSHPFMDAKRRIDAGEIGRPAMILARRGHQKRIVRNRRWLNDEDTGGVLNYVGVHNIDLMCWLMDSDPIRVYAESGKLILSQEQRFTDCAVMTILFENRGIGALYETFGFPDAYSHGVDRSVEILGDRGRIMIDLMNQPLTVVTDEEVAMSDSLTSPHFQGRIGGAMFNQANHFVASVLNEEPVLAPGEAGLLSIRIVEAAQQATETGQAQSL